MSLLPRRQLLAPLALAATGALVLGMAVSSEAATPPEGTVSDAARSIGWTGGPFLAPNTTATALDQPDCSAPESCDDFTLHVTTPADYGTAHQLKIDVAWENAAADFDVYVLDASGAVVGTGASSADPELVVLPPKAGDYTVRVVPFAPLGESYTAKATLVDKPADPAPGTDTPPGFTTYAAPKTFKDANNAGEPSIGSNHKTGSTMYQAYLSTYKVKFDDTVSPPSALWSDVSANAANGCVSGSTRSLDPILFTDHETGRTFESQLTGVNSATCYTDDDGATWAPSTGGGIPSGVDHQTIGGGPYSQEGTGALPTSDYPNAVYYCSQDIATAFCAASHDGGTTFGEGVPTYSLLDCSGLHGHVKVAPDGTAYLPNKACGENAAVAVSKDNGQSWTVHEVPGTTPSDNDPSVSIGKEGTVYFGYVGADGRPAVSVSTDQGDTWTAPQPVATEFDIKNAVFPAMIAGDDDRASLAFIGTDTEGNYQDAANFKGVWHLYIATTYDGGKTWVSSDATPNDPVQRGSICTGGTTCGNDRNLLDFIDATVDKTGHVEVGFADGCIDTCVTDDSQTSGEGPADAQASYATIARMSSGRTLSAANDPAPSGNPGSGGPGSGGPGSGEPGSGGGDPQPGTTGKPDLTITKHSVRRHHGKWVARFTVKNIGNATARRSVAHVKDNGKVVRRPRVARLAAGHSRTIRVTWRARKGTHRVVGVADATRRVAESNEKNNRFRTIVKRR